MELAVESFLEEEDGRSIVKLVVYERGEDGSYQILDITHHDDAVLACQWLHEHWQQDELPAIGKRHYFTAAD